MSYNHGIYCQQVGLKTLGFDPGPLDGRDGSKTRKALALSESKSFKAAGKIVKKVNGLLPPPLSRSRANVFGKAVMDGGKSIKFAKVVVPWDMYLYKDGGRLVRSISCHHMIAEPLALFLAAVYSELGDDGIRKYGFHLWYGCYVDRPGRGGSKTSDHAYAIAIDWNANSNKNYQSWAPDKLMSNGTRQFSKAVVSIAKAHGFQVGFKYGSGRRDMMHFAYVNRS